MICAIFVPIIVKRTVRRSVAVSAQGIAVMQKVPVLTQFIENLIKFLLKILAFQAVPKAVPGTEKSLSVAVHICPKLADQSGLHGNLLALGIAIHLLRCPHGAEGHFCFHLSLTLLFLFRLFFSTDTIQKNESVQMPA